MTSFSRPLDMAVVECVNATSLRTIVASLAEAFSEPVSQRKTFRLPATARYITSLNFTPPTSEIDFSSVNGIGSRDRDIERDLDDILKVVVERTKQYILI